MADATTAWVPPIVRMLGDQASPNPGTYSLNPNIRSQIDMLRDQWAMKFNTPNGWATDIANMPYGRWQFGNVQAPNGAPVGWGQRPTGAATGVPGVYGPGATVTAPTRPSNMDDWWRSRGIPTNTNGLLNNGPQGPAGPTSPQQATPQSPQQSLMPTGSSGAPVYAPQMPTPIASGQSGLLNQGPAPQAPPINYQGLPPEYIAQMGQNTPLPGTPAWWALITGNGAG